MLRLFIYALIASNIFASTVYGNNNNGSYTKQDIENAQFISALLLNIEAAKLTERECYNAYFKGPLYENIISKNANNIFSSALEQSSKASLFNLAHAKLLIKAANDVDESPATSLLLLSRIFSKSALFHVTKKLCPGENLEIARRLLRVVLHMALETGILAITPYDTQVRKKYALASCQPIIGSNGEYEYEIIDKPKNYFNSLVHAFINNFSEELLGYMIARYMVKQTPATQDSPLTIPAEQNLQITFPLEELAQLDATAK